MPLDLVSTLSDLVALASVNPMGRNVAAPEFFEWRITDYVEKLLDQFQIPNCRQPIAPLRDNLLAWVAGDVPAEAGGELLLFDVHQDTVGVEGMTIPPWTPTVCEGRLYGRGSCDVKGGLAVMLGALVRLAEERARGSRADARPRPTVVLACTVNEEHGFSGAKGLCRIWSDERLFATTDPAGKPIPPALLKLLPRRPDAAVVAEPTELKIVVAHKGMVRWRCHAHGRAAHSSNPARGDNAIYRMAPVVSLLERYSKEILPTLGEHRLCGRPTLSVGTIAGGSGVNTVPERCTIEIDHRLLPGDDPHAAWRRAVDFVSDGLRAIQRRNGTKTTEPEERCDELPYAEHVEHEPPMMHSSGLSDVGNGALAERLSSILHGVIGKAECIGVPFGTNAAIISAANVPTVVFGPGSIAQAHTSDEWISLDHLPLARDAIFQLMQSGFRRESMSAGGDDR